MGKLYVVRHSQVDLDPQIPAEEWPLSEAGRMAVAKLIEREEWPGVRTIYHSPERKAVQTAEVIAGRFGWEMKSHPGLRELKAETGFLPAEQFQARVAAYLEGDADPAFEEYSEAASRIWECVQEIVREAHGDSVAMVTHGRLLTVLYSRILGRMLSREEWQSIKLPDLSVIDLGTWTVERGFLANLHKG